MQGVDALIAIKKRELATRDPDELSLLFQMIISLFIASIVPFYLKKQLVE
jgi:hypothetical protein